MRFLPQFKLEILTEENFSEGIKIIEKELENCGNSGFFDTPDGQKLFYEYFLVENPKASIVIVHGLSEFTKKFSEVTYYFLNQGYNVFVYDQRGHGLSGRMTDDINLLHVDKFEDYVEDLSLFIDNVVSKAETCPIYIYSHSMGGAVSALYLGKHREKIKKAVFSAPMFEPTVTVVPMPIARWGVRAGRLFLGGKAKFPMSKEFNPEIEQNLAVDQSKARFIYNMNLRRNNRFYQTTPMSFGWTHGSLTVKAKILRKQTVGNIKTPILLLSSEKDRAVNNSAQYEFDSKCAACTLITVKNATHSMLSGYPEIINEHVTRVLEFFND